MYIAQPKLKINQIMLKNLFSTAFKHVCVFHFQAQALKDIKMAFFRVHTSLKVKSHWENKPKRFL